MVDSHHRKYWCATSASCRTVLASFDQDLGATTLHEFATLIQDIQFKFYDTAIEFARRPLIGNLDSCTNSITRPNRSLEAPRNLEQRERRSIQQTCS
jgi:hypothetical protein